MKRSKIIKGVTPSLILCSDFHLREDTPTCWIGDFQKEQWESVTFIWRLQKQYDCPVIHAGDLFDHWKPSPWLLSRAIECLPNQFYTIYGQHDLPQHNLELEHKTGVNTLRQAEVIHVLDGVHWGQTPGEHARVDFPTTGRAILVWHHLTYKGRSPFPGATGGQAITILHKYPQYDLIVTGDNHQSFTATYGKQLLVNPGNLTRQTADQIDYQPRVALWYAESNTIVWINIPIREGVISREHLDVKQQRDKRLEAFISKLDKDWKTETSFEDNLERFLKVNKVNDKVKQIIYKSLEP